MHTEQVKFARVAVLSPLKNPLIYRVPYQLQEQTVPGARALIPLGKRKVTGVILELLSEATAYETKDILEIQDEQPILDRSLLELSQWMCQYYLATIGEVVRTILPPSFKVESRRMVIAKAVSFPISGELERRVLEKLRENDGGISVKRLSREFLAGTLYCALDRLESSGAIEIRERPPTRRRKRLIPQCEPEPSTTKTRLVLSDEQQRSLDQVECRFHKGGFEAFLLHGVTGSGKTEVYLRAMERLRQLGRRGLILIPEISLTPQLIDRLNERFPGRVGILHSALSASERWAQWWRILRGDVDVVVGARSAVFAPVPDLGLVVVDEEHDPSYKQEEGLRYNSRDIAVVRAKLLGCPVILGSATPAIETYENSLRGRYRLLEMTRRIQDRPLPRVETVDLRSEFGGRSAPSAKTPESGHHLLTRRLTEELASNYRAGRQSLVFLNRRGFAKFLQCRACGFVIRCANCSVTLTLHLQQKSLYCHHCNFRLPLRELCPKCGNASLAAVGAGTEQIEEDLRMLLAGARIARMDRDTTTKRGSHEGLIRRWEKGEIDILVGTQMITKGHDVTGVTFVGALLADLSLNLPDFRAAERTFQLLSQVAGRSGRGQDPGRVVIQTYAPDHYALQHLISHDYKAFFAAEIEFRRALNYPPFSRLVNLRLDSPNVEEVKAKAKSLAAGLRKRQGKNPKLLENIQILGPAPAPIQKLRNRYRWQVLLKGKNIALLLELANHAREILRHLSRTRLHIDVDPVNML
jgi:primosomal protein N' (replication factor Y)